MQLINWLALQPLMADVDALNARLQEARPVGDVCRSLVEITLDGYPWAGRSDLIPCYHPSHTYKPGQWIALPVTDPQNARMAAWQVAHVKSAERTGNSVQGPFQALVLDVGGREVQRTGGLTGAEFPEPGFDSWSSEELGRLVDWVAETYAGELLATLGKLIKKGRVFGKCAGETFLPEQMFALSVDRLDTFFARLSPALCWVSLEEILQGLPDLSHLKHETALALIRSTLRVSPYRSLGSDRWTTPDLFEQMDRQVPYGLPGTHNGTKARLWTREDKKDLAVYRKRPIPAGAASAIEELLGERRSGPDPSPWQPLEELLQLPPLSTLSLTQACFPVGPVLHAFAPEVRMVFVQFLDGEYQPFLVDRELGLLKAVHPETLQTQILEAGLPAGIHLWLTYQGGEKYRISPKLLAAPRRVPCTRASLREGQLHFEGSQIQLDNESEASVFQADLSLDDIQVLHADARHARLSVQDALTSALLELCEAGPRKVASRADLFNAVFLKRSCSPQSVAVLLYSQPCFEEQAGETFRYLPQAPGMNIWKGPNRVSRLWEELVSSYVAPDPLAGKGLSPEEALEPEQLFELARVPDPGLSSSRDSMDISAVRAEEIEEAENTFIERIAQESIHLIKHTLEVLSAPLDEEPVEPKNREDGNAILTGTHEALEEVTVPVRALYPVMVRVSSEPEPQPGSAIDTRRIAYGLKIPARPLHKRPIYQRLFFCLRGWFHQVSGRRYETYPR